MLGFARTSGKVTIVQQPQQSGARILTRWTIAAECVLCRTYSTKACKFERFVTDASVCVYGRVSGALGGRVCVRSDYIGSWHLRTSEMVSSTEGNIRKHRRRKRRRLARSIVI